MSNSSFDMSELLGQFLVYSKRLKGDLNYEPRSQR
jgi:hypothetical protein